ncbi:glycosyltransferase family 2 protein [Polaribacter sp. OB-PA-B3]
MKPRFKITATIVLYKDNLNTLKQTIKSFLETNLSKKLFLVDNNPTDVLKSEFNHADVAYIFVGKNIGFGKAHNLVLDKVDSDFHLILNPDIQFTKLVLTNLINVLEKLQEVSFISPKVVYSNQENQFICRKNPTPFDLINRRLKLSKQKIFENEYRSKDLLEPFSPEFIHGCFMLFKTKEFVNLKGFDERYFLYMEDADICRKVYQSGKKIYYYPKEIITHTHQKGSSKKTKLFFYHLSSAIKYFLKWGI